MRRYDLLCLVRWCACAVLAVVLTGCGDDSDGNRASVSGTVIDGPVAFPEFVVRDSAGDIVAEGVGGADASYAFELALYNFQYPLTVTVTGGVNMVTGRAPDFPLQAVITEPGIDAVANLNPLGTLMTSIAGELDGGLTAANLEAARDIVMGSFGFGFDAGGIVDPMTTPASPESAAAFVRASEAAAETIRRVTDALLTIGQAVDPATVLASLASDLVDGRLNGQGGPAADPRVAAVGNVVAAEVLLETLANRLRVDGVEATAALDLAIQQVLPDATDVALTASLPTTEALIEQTRNALEAAQALVSNTALNQLVATVDALQPSAGPVAAETVLPPGSDGVLDLAVYRASAATTEELALVNGTTAEPVPSDPAPSDPAPEPVSPPPADQPVSGDTPTEPDTGTVTPPAEEPTPVNRAPSITGAPSGQVLAGQVYRFVPSASDPDGDALVFRVSNLPRWASFDPATGRVSGTPGAGDVGTYSSIRITVTDGQASASLPAFTIDVVAVANGSVTLSWTAPSQNADGTPLQDLAGYRVYRGTRPGVYGSPTPINNPGLTTYVIDGLTPGTYYFAVSAVDSAGLESALSNEAVKIIQ